MERATRRLRRKIFILRLTFYVFHFFKITTSENRQSPKVSRFVFPSHSMQKRILSQADASIAHLFSIWSTHTEKLLSKKKNRSPPNGPGQRRRKTKISNCPGPSLIAPRKKIPRAGKPLTPMKISALGNYIKGHT